MVPNLGLPQRSSAFYRKATAVVCVCNLLAILCVLYSIVSPLYSYSGADASSLRAVEYSERRPEVKSTTEEEAARIQEALEARRAWEPVDLIQRVKEIQEESSQSRLKWPKSSATRKKHATEIAERLNKSKGANSRSHQKALEEWRIRKLEAAKQHDLKGTYNMAKNETSVSLRKKAVSRKSQKVL